MLKSKIHKYLEKKTQEGEKRNWRDWILRGDISGKNVGTRMEKNERGEAYIKYTLLYSSDFCKIVDVLNTHSQQGWE